MINKRLPIGISDFRKLIKEKFYYVDKSDFIREVIESSAQVILLPRPRRFGKTLNLSMLKYFFEKNNEASGQKFKGLAIEKSDCFKTHQGKYPVIWLTLKDVKEPGWKECLQHLKTLIRNEYSKHRYLLEKDILFPEEKKWFESILTDVANVTDFGGALKYLGEYLHRFHKREPVILIDEYDTPLYAGYNHGYYEQVIGFLRNFLSGGLKDNPHLFKGVLTGVLRVAKESIFSGLNNLGVYSILTEEFNEAFGFTDDETRKLLADFGVSDHYEEVVEWYNGYLFGKRTIYNPWSLINYTASKSKKPAPYWTNTGDTAIVERLATRGGKEIREEIGQLMEGRRIREPIYETIVMRDLDRRDDLIWSFLLFSGYLKPVRQIDDEIWELDVPNREVLLAYRNLVRTWFAAKVEQNCLREMLEGLENGNVELFERLLRKVVEQIMSFHDLSGRPEKVYHALVLGMLVWMSGKYEIRSNRESGYGRYDIMLKPREKSRAGIIIEFKLVERTDENAHELVLNQALKQIEDRGYAAELTASGISNILQIAVAFKGKRLWVGYKGHGKK